MTKTKRNLVLIILCIVMLMIAVCPVSASQNSAGVVKTSAVKNNKFSYMQISKDYTEVATSGNLTMSADLSSGMFAIKNLNNGYVWYSVPDNTKYDSFSSGQEKKFTQSVLTVGYVIADDEVSSPTVMYMDSYSATPEVEQIDNGIRVNYQFEIDMSVSSADNDGKKATDASQNSNDEQKLISASVPVEFYLEDGHLSARVDIKGAKIPKEIIVSEYCLLPYFASADWTHDGYIFVPDGSGALINFNGHENNLDEYNEMIYGSDLSLVDNKGLETGKQEILRMPVFGIADDNGNAICGVVVNNEAAASIVAGTHTDSKGYSNVYTKISTKITSSTAMFGRSSSTQKIYRLSDDCKSITDFKVNYYILDGSKANYVGMAQTYRDYLVKNDMLSKNVSKPSLNVDLYGAIDVKANFLGFTYSKLTQLTSFEQATKIAKDLNDNSISALSLRYIGWANNGTTNKNAPKSAKPLSLLGGSDDYNNLISYAKKNNIGLTNDVDLISYTEGKGRQTAKNGFGGVYYKSQYLKSVYAYDLGGVRRKFLNPKYIPEYATKMLSSYSKLGVTNISLGTLSNQVYSSLKRDENFYRADYTDVAAKVYETAKKNNLTVSGEKANAYSFKYVDKIYKSPTYSSAYTLFDSEIPFYQIVLHGYTVMTGDAMVQSFDTTTNYLKCVESGIELLWSGIYEDSAQLNITSYDDLYGSNYKLWSGDAAKKYKEYQPLLEKIYDKQIVAHKELTSLVTSTTYENGITVYVNYSDKEYKTGNIVVPATGFTYREG